MRIDCLILSSKEIRKHEEAPLKYNERKSETLIEKKKKKKNQKPHTHNRVKMLLDAVTKTWPF